MEEVIKKQTNKNIREATKAALKGKFVAIQAYLRKQEKSQITNLTWQLKQQEKEQSKLKICRRKESIKIRAEINEIETKKYQ